MRASQIVLPDDVAPTQQALFNPLGLSEDQPHYLLPPIGSSIEDFERILHSEDENLGLDFEYNIYTHKPSITGLSNSKEACAIRWTDDTGQALIDMMGRGKKMVAFSTASADKPVLDQLQKTSIDSWDDGMLSHYLVNSDLCKMPAKDESEDAGAMGFMNLWTASSLTLDLPNWKICRGSHCEGPCPTHKVFDYCAMDAYSGERGHAVNVKRMERLKIPHKLYRELLELSEMTYAMERQGVAVDFDYVRRIDSNADEVKDALFNSEIVDGTKVYDPFNPRSNIQVTNYFKDQHYTVDNTQYSIKLPSNSKATIQKKLQMVLKKVGLPHKDQNDRFTTDLITDEMLATVDASVRHLIKLYQYKDFGKGLSAWFDEKKYKIDWLEDRSRGLIHPRFVVPATQTGRLSSSRPNFMNIPARGWGEIVRAAVVAREPGWYLVKSDFSNLEFRMCLYLSGFDLSQIGSDAFTWLVNQAPDAFAEAAGWIGWSPRDVAKSVSHAADYLEGLRLLKPYELDLPRTKREVEAGALRIYRD